MDPRDALVGLLGPLSLRIVAPELHDLFSVSEQLLLDEVHAHLSVNFFVEFFSLPLLQLHVDVVGPVPLIDDRVLDIYLNLATEYHVKILWLRGIVV